MIPNLVIGDYWDEFQDKRHSFGIGLTFSISFCGYVQSKFRHSNLVF